MYQRGYIIVLLAFIVFNVHGQMSEMDFDKKHKVNIFLATNNGSKEVPNRFMEQFDSIFFLLETKGDWNFSKGDVKDLADIKFYQTRGTTDLGRKLGKYNESDKLTMVLVGFPLDKIDLTAEFQLKYDEHESGVLLVPERYWPHYTEFDDFYTSANSFYNQEHYIAAYQQLESLLPGNKNYPFFQHFDRYEQAVQNLMPNVVKGYQEHSTSQLNSFKSSYENADNVSAEELAKFRQQRDSVELVYTLFDAYYRLNDPVNRELMGKHIKLSEDYAYFYDNLYDKWKKTVLSVLESGYYLNENKYEVYIELLSRLLIYKDSLSGLKPFDSINSKLISDPTQQIGFLKRHIDILDIMDWKEEFLVVIQLINNNILENRQILPTQHMMNLKYNMSKENQPNYFIFLAFDDLAKGNFEIFEKDIAQAISKATDKEIMYYLELWNFSYLFRVRSANEKLLETINSGLAYERKMLPNEAFEMYKMAKRIDSRSALPPFLMGKIKLEIKDESFVAERYFDQAINVNPQFALARIYHLEQLIEGKQFETALDQIQAITNYPDLNIWYIFYLKAKILLMQEEYQKALTTIENSCAPINPNNFDQYILLGEIYLKLNNCEKSKENFQSAGSINPDHPDYAKKMREFTNNCSN